MSVKKYLKGVLSNLWKGLAFLGAFSICLNIFAHIVFYKINGTIIVSPWCDSLMAISLILLLLIVENKNHVCK